MSNRLAETRPGGGTKPPLPRVPMYVPPLLLVAAGVIGLLFAVPNGTVNKPYFIAFAIAAVIGTTMVVPRGLVVTVAQIPLLFALITFSTAWFTGSFADPENGGVTSSTSRRARFLTSAYPIIQQFPWLVGIMVVCIIIGVWRYLKISRIQQQSLIQQTHQARRRQDRDDARIESSTQVRRRLAESERRAATRTSDAAASRRPAADIIRNVTSRHQTRQQAPQRQQGFDRPAARPAPRPGQAPQSGQAPQPRTAQPPRSQPPPSQARRPIIRPNRPVRPTQGNPRRHAGDSERVWGEQPPRPARPARPADRTQQRPRPTANHNRRTEEWPPRQQRPRQGRVADRDLRREGEQRPRRYDDDSRHRYRQ